MKVIAIGVTLLASALAHAPGEPTRPDDVAIGKLELRISEAESAQVFHVVDQLSEWNQFCHRQYGRWAAKELSLNDLDRTLLAQHAQMRKARGWGAGFEQAFYVDSSISQAAEAALGAGILSPDEVETEAAILLHFAPILRPMLDAGRDESRRFRARLVEQAERLAPMVDKLAHFAGVSAPIVVPVFLIPNPEKGFSGGGYNGGRLALEIQADPDPMPTLLHESMHAVLDSRRNDIAEAARRGTGLDQQTLGEGLTYAVAPGIISRATDGSDELSEWVAIDVLRGVKPADSILRFKLVALVVRPLLRDALDRGGTLDEFLPRAVDKWNQVQRRR